MPTTLVVTVLALIACAGLGRHFLKLPNNIWLLFIAQPMAMAATSLMVFAGGILGTHLAPKPELATLPITLLIIGIALSVIPASLLTKKLGRRNSLLCGLGIAVIGALIAMSAALFSTFSLLLLGAFLLGCSMAFVAQMRFAALESLQDENDSAKAISILMLGGIFAAVLGPELAVAGKDWLNAEHGFAGSFMALAILLLFAMVIVSRLSPSITPDVKSQSSARALTSIISQPIFLLALSSAAIAYGLMSYVMTATPLSMHIVQGHSLEQTKFVVQSHIIAMYLPSMFATLFIRWFGILRIMMFGCACYIAVIAFALSGQEVMHYWFTMVLLGVGWNFLFMSGTLLLPKSYQHNERLAAQSFNDFTIFFVQALASLLAGIVLFNQGWLVLIALGTPLVLLIIGITFAAMRSKRIKVHLTP